MYIIIIIIINQRQTFHRVPGFYWTSRAVDYMAVIFYTHLDTVKCKVCPTTVLGKYSCVLSQQSSWRIPLDFQQIAYASPLHVC